MRLMRTLLLGAGVLLQSTLNNALILDSSCNDYEDFLKVAFGEAFSLASLGAGKLQDPVAPPYANLAGLLFGSSSNWGEAQGRLSKVSSIPSDFTTDKGDKSNPANMIIYCNMDRFIPRQRGGGYTDPDSGIIWSLSDPDDFTMCKTGQTINGKPRPKAMTANYESLDFQNPVILASMDICNWYLEEVKASQYKTESDVSSDDSNPSAAKVWRSFVGVGQAVLDLIGSFGKTEIDTAALFEHTLLHELTHNEVVGPKQPADTEAYGWDKCVDAKNPQNSESLAFFALGCDIINDGFTVQQNGDIVSNSAASRMVRRLAGHLRRGAMMAQRFKA